MKNAIAILAALAVVLSAMCGCVTGASSSGTSAAGRYWLTVGFNPKLGTKSVLHKMEFIVSPGVPFAVKTFDLAGNQFEVSGTMRQTAPEKFAFDEGRIVEKMPGVGELQMGIYDLSVGRGYGGADYPTGIGFTVILTKK